MELYFKCRKLEKACSQERDSVREWGAELARAVRRRLSQLAAAECLATVSALPPARLRPLAGARKGCFSIDVIGSFFLVLEPYTDDAQVKDGKLNTAQITGVCIIGIEESHDR